MAIHPPLYVSMAASGENTSVNCKSMANKSRIISKKLKEGSLPYQLFVNTFQNTIDITRWLSLYYPTPIRQSRISRQSYHVTANASIKKFSVDNNLKLIDKVTANNCNVLVISICDIKTTSKILMIITTNKWLLDSKNADRVLDLVKSAHHKFDLDIDLSGLFNTKNHIDYAGAEERLRRRLQRHRAMS